MSDQPARAPTIGFRKVDDALALFGDPEGGDEQVNMFSVQLRDAVLSRNA